MNEGLYTPHSMLSLPQFHFVRNECLNTETPRMTTLKLLSNSYFMLVFLILQLVCQTPLNTETRNLHNVLVTFIAKGQLVIEQFPPLSLILATQLSTLSLFWVAVGSQLLVAFTLAYSLPIKPTVLHSVPSFLCVIILASVTYLIGSQSYPDLSPLKATSWLGSSVQILVVLNMISTEPEQRGWADDLLGVPEVLLILGYYIGSNEVDVTTSYLLLLLIRITAACNAHRGNLYSNVSSVNCQPTPTLATPV